MADDLAERRTNREVRRRLHADKGICNWCRQSAARFQGVGPLHVTIGAVEDLEILDGQKINLGSEQMDQIFCCWECLCDWTLEQSGRDPIAPRGSCSLAEQ